MRWIAHAVSNFENPFWTNLLNYPDGVNLLNNTVPMFLGVVMTPVTLLFGSVASFNVLQTLAFATSAAAMYILVLRWVSWWPAAFVAGLLYGFSPFAAASGWGHLYMIFVPMIPLIILCLDQILIRQTGSAIRWGLLLALLVVAQFFTSLELLVLTAELSLVGVVLLALAHRDQIRIRAPYAFRALAVCTVVCLFVLAYPIWFGLFGPQAVRIHAPAEFFSADLLGPFIPTSNQAIATEGLRDLGDRFTGQVIRYRGHGYQLSSVSYVGLPLVILLAVTIVRMRRVGAVRLFAALGAVAFVMSLGPTLKVAARNTGVPMPGRMLTYLPLLDATAPFRYALFVTIAVAVLLAIALDRLHAARGERFKNARARTGGAILVALVVLVPLIPRFPYRMEHVDAPRFIRTGAFATAIPRGSAVLGYPFPGPLTAQTMQWQARTGMHYRMVGGYQFVPDGKGGTTLSAGTSETQRMLARLYRDGTLPPLTRSVRMSVLRDLRSWRVSTILVAMREPGAADAVRLFTRVVREPPDRELDVALWRVPQLART